MEKLLLIEADPRQAKRVRDLLHQPEDTIEVRCADRLSRGLEMVASEEFEAVLLDLELPDSSGLQTFLSLQAQEPNVPVLVLADSHDSTVGEQAVGVGAQDCVLTNQLRSTELKRSIRLACERHRLHMGLRELCLEDELTGIYNLRGLRSVGKQLLHLARREQRTVTLLFLDVDGFKLINDTLGHATGNQVLQAVAHLLQTTFRESDVIARVGGDEFVIVAMDLAEPAIERIRLKTRQLIAQLGKDFACDLPLSLSIGSATSPAGDLRSIDILMALADESMYREKRHTKLATAKAARVESGRLIPS